jgi:putative tricarboxylic transport membrane protein
MARTFSPLIGIAAAICAACLPLHAADWKPTRPIEIVAGGTAGGGYDRQARVLQRILQERKLVDVPVNVINKPGGSSALGWAHLTQHPGEGHVVAVASTTYLTNDVLGINPFRYTELTPLALMATEYLVFSVKADSPMRTGRDLAERIRQNVRGVTFATAPGPGNANHIVLGMVARPLGVDVKQIPFVFFKSAGESATALLGGHVQVVIGSIPPVLEHARSGKLRLLALAAPNRLGGDLQDVPTWKEQGIDAEFRNWRGVLGPRGLSREQVAYWEGVLAAVTKSDEWKRDVEGVHATTAFVGSTDATRQLAVQQKEILQTLKDLGIAK